MLIYPSIFTFPWLPLHHQSTTTHHCTNATTRDHTHTCFIGLSLLIWWTHVLQFTCFISILSIPNVRPPTDGPPHQIHSYTLLFLLFHYFLYIVDPPLCTPALMRPHVITLALASSDRSCLFDGHMFYNSLLFLYPQCPPTVRPIMSPHTMQSGTFYSYALDEPYALSLVDYSYLTFLYLPFNTHNLPIWVSPRIQN